MPLRKEGKMHLRKGFLVFVILGLIMFYGTVDSLKAAQQATTVIVPINMLFPLLPSFYVMGDISGIQIINSVTPGLSPTYCIITILRPSIGD
jgi:hypothetical protein